MATTKWPKHNVKPDGHVAAAVHAPVIHPSDDGSSILIYERNGGVLIEGWDGGMMS